jgi:Regulator of ribonuclease activity B
MEFLMAGKKLKIGDIAEIATPKGLAYVQYTHETKDFGELVRVLPGLYVSRPPDFAELAKQPELYFVFYTLKYALRAGQTEIVSNQPIPEWAKLPPMMRHAAGTAPDGRTLSWRIVPALAELTVPFLQQTPVVTNLTDEQRKLSIHHLWPHALIVDELARGWTPERNEELEDQDRARAQARRKAGQQEPGQPVDQAMRHYLYFPEKSNAEEAAQWFGNQGFSVETKLSGDGDNWLTLVKHGAPQSVDEMDKLKEEMEALALRLNGEYDGWELATDKS